MKHCPNESCDHLIRYGRVAEFTNSVDVCSDCGSELRHGEVPPEPAVEYLELQTIYETSNSIQAHLIKSVLEQHDISAYVSGDSLQGAVGEIPPTMLYIRLQVPLEDAERAREIVLQTEASPE
jgi:hypothetical protein